MAKITYENLKISTIPYLHILELRIEQKINEHGKAKIICEVEPDIAQECIEKITEEDTCNIIGNNKVLFCGLFAKLEIQHQADATWLEIGLESTSKILDYGCEKHSYQHTSATYGQIMKEAVARQKGQLIMQVEDRTVPGLVVQYRETIWEFVKRMAAECGTCVITDNRNVKPMIYVGIPDYEEVFITPQNKGNFGSSGFTEEFLYVGAMNSGECITKTESVMEGGVLRTYYETAKLSRLPKAVSSDRHTQKYSLAGKVFGGIVQKVEADKVQVHITDLDEQYDAGGDWYFPYSTIYSSANNEAGYYCMPQKDDSVRVFFPTDRAEDAFAASSVNMRGARDNMLEKCFQSPAGMEVLFTEKGLYITCKGKNVCINMEQDSGITIEADTSITMFASKDVKLHAYENIKVTSENEIYLGTDTSFIHLGKSQSVEDANSMVDGIDVYAPKIFVK